MKIMKHRLNSQKRILALFLTVVMLWTMGLGEVVGAIAPEGPVLSYGDASGNPTTTELEIKSGESKDFYVEYDDITYVKFVPDESGDYRIESLDSGDTYGILYNAGGEYLTANDDDGDDYNFRMNYSLEADEIYYIGLKFYDGQGYITLRVQKTSDLSWSIEGNVLTISGTGPMTSAPWYDAWDDEEVYDVVIKDGVTTICDGAFQQAPIDSVVIPESVTEIDDSAFVGCTLENVTIPASVKRIGEEAFANCSLRSITLSNGIENIEWGAFSRCSQLESVYIPGSVTKISSNVFEYCKGLKSVEIGEGVKVIGSCAFSNCSNLTNLKLGESLEEIGYCAFENCDSLTTVNIPAGVTEIDSDAFYRCENISSFSVDKSNKTYASSDGILYNKEMTKLIKCPVAKTGSVSIPESVKSIGSSAFELCKSVTTVDIPSSVTYIGDSAFASSGLTDIKIPSGVTEINTQTFALCENLKNVELSQNVTDIVYQAFWKSGLTSIDLPKSVAEIEESAFCDCEDLSEITFNSVPNIAHDAFAGVIAIAYYDPADGWTEELMQDYDTYLTHLTWTVKCALVTPTITKIENAATGVKLTWDKVNGAEKYRVYYRLSDATKWSKLDTTGTAATVTGLTSGKNYDFTVKAMAGSDVSDAANKATIVYCAMPTVSKTENNATGVQLTWGKVTGATKYRVYYKLSDASKYTTFKDVTSTSATVTGLTAGKSYIFTVKAYNGSTWSANKATSAVVYRPVPAVTKLTNAAKGITVTWTKISGASKYALYYKVSDASSWTRFSNTLTTNSATVTGLTSGKSYVFTVKAYVGGGWSTNVSSSAIVYRPVPTVSKLTNAAKGITVTWGKISGASKYALYYKVSGASKWTLFSNTLTTNSAIVTGLTSGKSYVFTVKAYVGGGWSSNVSSSAIIRVNAVTLSGLTNSASKTMKATWKKDTTLTGYQIQYSLKKDFSDAKTVTVKSNTTVSQTIKSLTKGKTYYVRIRGYKTVSKVTTYGAWSAAKTVKISK